MGAEAAKLRAFVSSARVWITEALRKAGAFLGSERFLIILVALLVIAAILFIAFHRQGSGGGRPPSIPRLRPPRSPRPPRSQRPPRSPRKSRKEAAARPSKEAKKLAASSALESNEDTTEADLATAQSLEELGSTFEQPPASSFTWR